MRNIYRRLLTWSLAVLAVGAIGVGSASAQSADTSRQVVRPIHNKTVDTYVDRTYGAAGGVIVKTKAGIARLFGGKRPPRPPRER